MAAYYFDSSALVKHYVQETGTAWVQGLLDPAQGNSLFVIRITLVEIAAAFSRRIREGSLTASQALLLRTQLASDFANTLSVIEVAPAIAQSASKFTESHPLRAYDAVQLAGGHELHSRRKAAALSPLTFVSADSTLNAAAQAIGLLVDDPNSHP